MCTAHKCQCALAVGYVVADGYQSPCIGIAKAPLAQIIRIVEYAITHHRHLPYLLGVQQILGVDMREAAAYLRQIVAVKVS